MGVHVCVLHWTQLYEAGDFEVFPLWGGPGAGHSDWCVENPALSLPGSELAT